MVQGWCFFVFNEEWLVILIVCVGSSIMSVGLWDYLSLMGAATVAHLDMDEFELVGVRVSAAGGVGILSPCGGVIFEEE